MASVLVCLLNTEEGEMKLLLVPASVLSVVSNDQEWFNSFLFYFNTTIFWVSFYKFPHRFCFCFLKIPVFSYWFKIIDHYLEIPFIISRLHTILVPFKMYTSFPGTSCAIITIEHYQPSHQFSPILTLYNLQSVLHLFISDINIWMQPHNQNFVTGFWYLAYLTLHSCYDM